MSLTNLPNGLMSMGVPIVPSLKGNAYFVKSTSDSDYDRFYNDRYTVYSNGNGSIFSTIQGALDVCSDKDTVFIFEKEMAAGATDPSSWAETLTVAAGKSGLSIIGVSDNRTQGGLPQIRKG